MNLRSNRRGGHNCILLATRRLPVPICGPHESSASIFIKLQLLAPSPQPCGCVIVIDMPLRMLLLLLVVLRPGQRKGGIAALLVSRKVNGGTRNVTKSVGSHKLHPPLVAPLATVCAHYLHCIVGSPLCTTRFTTTTITIDARPQLMMVVVVVVGWRRRGHEPTTAQEVGLHSHQGGRCGCCCCRIRSC